MVIDEFSFFFHTICFWIKSFRAIKKADLIFSCNYSITSIICEILHGLYAVQSSLERKKKELNTFFYGEYRLTAEILRLT